VFVNQIPHHHSKNHSAGKEITSCGLGILLIQQVNYGLGDQIRLNHAGKAADKVEDHGHDILILECVENGHKDVLLLLLFENGLYFLNLALDEVLIVESAHILEFKWSFLA